MIKCQLEYLYQMFLVEPTSHSIHQDNVCKQLLCDSSCKPQYGDPKNLLVILCSFMDFMCYLDDFRSRIVSIAHFQNLSLHTTKQFQVKNERRAEVLISSYSLRLFTKIHLQSTLQLIFSAGQMYSNKTRNPFHHCISLLSCVDLGCDAARCFRLCIVPLFSLAVGHGKCDDEHQSHYSFIPSSRFWSGLILFSVAGE